MLYSHQDEFLLPWKQPQIKVFQKDVHAVFHREGVGPGIPHLPIIMPNKGIPLWNLLPPSPPPPAILSEAGYHYKRDNEKSKMRRMKEEEKEIREGWGVKEVIGRGIRRGNCSGMEP